MPQCKSCRYWKQVPDTAGFNTTPEFNRLTINFEVNIKQEIRRLASKFRVDTAPDIAGKKQIKQIIKLHTFDLSRRRHFGNDRSQNDLNANTFLISSEC